MDILFLDSSILHSNNGMEFEVGKIHYEGIVIKNVPSSICYPNVLRNPNDNKVYLYYKKGVIGNETTCRFVSDDGISFTDDKIVINKNNSVCHNLICFVDENPVTLPKDKVKVVGGQHRTISWGGYKNKNYPIINGLLYDPNMCDRLAEFYGREGTAKIYSPFEKCENYSNGLHCFCVREDKLYSINEDLPIIHGLHEGRYDAFYGSVHATENTTINDLEKFRNNGLSVFDGSVNIIYFKNKYFLYCRANLSQANRYIQYAVSDDLKKWSQFNLITILKNESTNIFRENFYYCNFFTFNDICLAILPYSKKKRFMDQKKERYMFGGPSNVYEKGQYVLLYSKDGINWHHLGKFAEYLYEKDLLAIGKVFSNDGLKHYFYMCSGVNIRLYSIRKNRFMAMVASQDKICSCILKKIRLTNQLKINCRVGVNGYIKLGILTDNLQPLSEYTIDNFDIITGPLDELEQLVTWKNNTISPNNNEYHINIEMKNANIYSLSY